MKAFVIDVSICNGCYNCQIACKDEHVANDWTPYAKPQPDTGQFWMKLNEFVRGTVPKVKMHYLPVPCMHCDQAPCLKACPIKGVITKREDGLVLINAEKCTGCKNCVDACPYGKIYFNEDLNLAQKCTGCAHLLDKGWKEPRCVDACPHSAIKFGEESELRSLIAGSETLHPEYGTKPRVHYIGLPKRFIAGTVYDPGAKEVVIGARCNLVGEGDSRTVTMDEFGDFWLEGLAAGDYTLTIEKDGKTRRLKVSTKEKDIGMGDIALS